MKSRTCVVKLTYILIVALCSFDQSFAVKPWTRIMGGAAAYGVISWGLTASVIYELHKRACATERRLQESLKREEALKRENSQLGKLLESCFTEQYTCRKAFKSRRRDA